MSVCTKSKTVGQGRNYTQARGKSPSSENGNDLISVRSLNLYATSTTSPQCLLLTNKTKFQESHKRRRLLGASFIRSAPADIVALATTDLYVSMLIGVFIHASRKDLISGITLTSSSSRLTCAVPGRVLQPPTCRISAPGGISSCAVDTVLLCVLSAVGAGVWC